MRKQERVIPLFSRDRINLRPTDSWFSSHAFSAKARVQTRL